jgi:hypothetical protein
VWTALAAAVLIVASAVSGAEEGYVVRVYKGARRLELWRNGEMVRDFEVALGANPVGHKEAQGDKRTPVGSYSVSEKHVSRRFHRFIGLSYPNVEDANRGYEGGVISAGQWADLFVAEERGQSPDAATGLGGRIGIHGYGARPYIPVIDWTDGCVAVSNEESEYLYQRLPIGTPVLIYD